MLQLVKKMLFPTQKSCELCRKPYYEQPLQSRPLHMLCKPCNEQIRYITQPICRICGREPYQKHEEICQDCRTRTKTYFVSNRSAVHYTAMMKEWIYTYKFHGREHLVLGLVELLYKAYRTYYQDIDFDAITFIPLHTDRLYERRFNQAEQLAVGLAQKTNLPLQSTLERIRDTRKQSQQSRHERMKSVRGVFTAAESVKTGTKILLVDDIYTTGSTVNEAAFVLQNKGWQHIYVCTVARA